jgi:uncharacterized membrane protein YphA (DoxX/SURF4 family)
MPSIKKPVLITSWVLQLIVVAIFVMTAVPKFSGAEESKAIFEVLGAEPMGRYAVGVAELIAAVLLLVPCTNAIGAVVSLGVISGAILSHLFRLGVSIDPVALDKPELGEVAGASMFAMAVLVFVASLGIIMIRRSQLPIIGAKFNGEPSE